MLARLLLAFAVAGLSACASLPPPAAVPPAPTFVAGSFALEGRLSLRQGETRHHVGINWRHEPARDEIFLSGLLGQGLAELSRDATGARLLTADRQMIEAADWESLAERAFGVRLPLSNLPRLLAAPSGTVPPARPEGSPLGVPTLEIDGWRIDILEVADGRPALMELRRDDIEARLKIDSWQR